MNDFARGFLKALTCEYVDKKKPNVGDFLKGWQCNEKAACKLEDKVRKAKGRDGRIAAIDELRRAIEAGEHAALFQAASLRQRNARGGSHRSSSSGSSSSGSDGVSGGSSDEGSLRGANRDELHAIVDSHVGGCVLRQSAREPPSDLHALRVCSSVNRTDEFERFPKIVTAGGVSYIGAEDSSEQFLLAVGSITAEMFAVAPCIDVAKQLEVMKHNHCYRATCPISKGDDEGCVEPTLLAQARNSICDRIGEGIDHLQAMEVLEHVLHHITDVGMHYAFPQEWGLCEGSRLHKAMQEAIAKGLYDISDYAREMEDAAHAHECLRVQMQEFGYWIITTSWDVQAEFGPWNGIEPDAEWKVRTAAELQEKLPLSHSLCVDTVVPTLVAPKAESLRALAAFGGTAQVAAVAAAGYEQASAPAAGLYVVAWHVNDHAKGRTFTNLADAKKAYLEVSRSYAKRLYDPSGRTLEEYGSMSSYNWAMLDDLAEKYQGEHGSPRQPR